MCRSRRCEKWPLPHSFNFLPSIIFAGSSQEERLMVRVKIGTLATKALAEYRRDPFGSSAPDGDPLPTFLSVDCRGGSTSSRLMLPEHSGNRARSEGPIGGSAPRGFHVGQHPTIWFIAAGRGRTTAYAAGYCLHPVCPKRRSHWTN